MMRRRPALGRLLTPPLAELISIVSALHGHAGPGGYRKSAFPAGNADRVPIGVFLIGWLRGR